ncbi:MAG TPA: mechanosensitive ion channel, partial [Burkholderiaceae bacterium]|nr:mechanosensitive ion channel [Burkholderiaceae bacterium]
FALVKAVVDDIRAMLQAHPDIDSTETLIVNFNAYAGSSLDLMVYAFTHTTGWVAFQHIKQDVLLQIGKVIEQHGAQIAFPTQTLHLANDDAGSGRADAAQAPADAVAVDRPVRAGADS